MQIFMSKNTECFQSDQDAMFMSQLKNGIRTFMNIFYCHFYSFHQLPQCLTSYSAWDWTFYGFTVLRLCIWQTLLQKIISVLIGFDQLKLSLGIELMFYCLSCRNVFRKLWQATKLMGFSRNADLEPCRRKTKKVGEWSFLIFWQEDYGAGAQQETDELLHAR